MPVSPPFAQRRDSVVRAPFLAGVSITLLTVAVFLGSSAVLSRDWPLVVINVVFAVALGCMFRYWMRRTVPHAARVVLGTADFGRLVRGMWVARPGVRIILADVGFQVMATEVRNAAIEASGGQVHVP